ncbi:hypothetical protein KY290_009198 [Solanum tuberosum]|uniref:Uncharacterized protein n=1 Tax=Solanum tuberosum TaxID=4113 RepID=A0ABQ7WAJ8_SOLTU|nr:hypothetical protein KY290_009198 [Solanum tuberosum]
MGNDRQTKDLRSPCVLALCTGIAEFESAGSDEWLLASFALQGREGIRAGRKGQRSSYGHKEVRNRTIAGVDRGSDLDVERSSQAEAEKKAYDYVGVK